MSLFKNVLTARRDGTTERLNAIVHGIYLAKKLNWNFNFSWVVDVGAIENEFLSVDNFLPPFFNQQFVVNHYIEFNQFKDKYLFEGQSTTMCEYVSGTEFKKIPKETDLEGDFNILAPSVFHGDTRAELEYIVKEVIEPAYFSFKEAGMAKIKGFTGLHYRGGDVIYGPNRHGNHAIGDKSVSLAVLEDYISKRNDENFIIFGTPIGDTENDMNYLNNKYSNIVLSKDFRVDSLDHVLQDCFLMSCCKEVVSMSGTGVTRFSKMINSSLKRSFFHDEYDENELYHLYFKGAYNLEYNNLQRAFHAANALNLNKTEIDTLLELIKSLDCDNKLSWLN